MAGVDWESLAEATSGAVGALVSTTVFYPLDTCKSKYQAEVQSQGKQKYRKLTDVLEEAIREHKVLSLYQGLGTKNLQSFIAQFIYFYGYSYFKRLYLRKSGAKSVGTAANLIVGAVAGCCTVILTHPLDTAASRMQTSEFGKSKSLVQTLTGGSFTEAFDAIGISLLLTSNPSIQYTVFDQLKQRHLNRQSKLSGEPSKLALSAFSAFLLGAVSKTVATVLTYPAIRARLIVFVGITFFPTLLAVVQILAPTKCKVMIQSADHESQENGTENGTENLIKKPKSPKTFLEALRAIWSREGLPGFFKGLQPQILKTVLSSALLLMIKEKISRFTWIALLAIKQSLLNNKKRVKSV